MVETDPFSHTRRQCRGATCRAAYTHLIYILPSGFFWGGSQSLCKKWQHMRRKQQKKCTKYRMVKFIHLSDMLLSSVDFSLSSTASNYRVLIFVCINGFAYETIKLVFWLYVLAVAIRLLPSPFQHSFDGRANDSPIFPIKCRRDAYQLCRTINERTANLRLSVQ